MSNVTIVNTDVQLRQALFSIHQPPIFILCDTNTLTHSFPLLQPWLHDTPHHLIVIEAGDENKTLDAVASIWTFLSQHQASRHSLMINLGGGMLTDIGGFAASTFKRGMPFINLPTSLLGAVDAAVGGKTGFNFNGLKNEIGVFSHAQKVLIYPPFFSTLPAHERLSGYAEMLKHALLVETDLWQRTLSFDPLTTDMHALSQLVLASIEVKEQIVLTDPFERGIRKALNLGHTIAHAIESLAFERSEVVSHGYAVAWGLVAELYLSHLQLHFPLAQLRRLSAFVKHHYGAAPVRCTDYDKLIQYMRHDKKNVTADTINFTLLHDVGKVEINCTATPHQIIEALDYLQEM